MRREGALAFRGGIGKGPRTVRIACKARSRPALGLAPPQVLAQLGGEPFLTGKILARVFTHAKRIGLIGGGAQVAKRQDDTDCASPLDIAKARDNRARLFPALL